MDGSNGSTTFTDSSSFNCAVTRDGDVSISTVQSRFGGASAYFDGAGDRLAVDDVNARIGSGDFTVEVFVMRDATQTGVETVLWEQQNNSNTGGGVKLRMRGSTPSGRLSIQHFNSSADAAVITATTLVPTDAWIHVAVVRHSGVIKLYVAGVSEGGQINSTLALPSASIYFGSTSSLAALSFYKGFMDEVRITKGIARYTANFTPPTGPFPDS
jgi:hypothetical protein